MDINKTAGYAIECVGLSWESKGRHIKRIPTPFLLRNEDGVPIIYSSKKKAEIALKYEQKRRSLSEYHVVWVMIEWSWTTRCKLATFQS